MFLRGLRTLGLGSFLVLGAIPWSSGQALVENLTQGTNVASFTQPTVAGNEGDFSALSAGAATGITMDYTGSGLTNVSAPASLTGVAAAIISSANQSAESGKPRALIGSQAMFGASPTAGSTTMNASGISIFGDAGSNTGTGTPGPGASSRTSAHVGPGGASPSNLTQAHLSGTNQNAHLHSDSSSTSGAATHGSATSAGTGSTNQASSTAGLNDSSDTVVSSSGGGSGTATYTTSFPNSTQGTALLSPTDTASTPFSPASGELSFSLPNLDGVVFLKPSLRAGVRSGGGQNSEDQYERFKERLRAEQASSATSGLSKGLSRSSSRSFGSRAGYGSTLRPSTGLGSGTGRQTSNSASPHY
jgi:hypothetical protein